MTAGAATAAPSRAGVHWPVVTFAFLAVIFDGFDTAVLSLSVPTLAADWRVPPAEFTLPLTLTSIGVVLGYLVSGTAAAWLGRRRLLLAGLAVFGVSTLLCAAVLPLQSIAALAVVRLVTGLGLGAVVPIAVTYATGHSAAERRATVTTMVMLGITVGVTISGFLGGHLVTAVGVGGVFVIGGIAPLLLVAVTAWRLPADAQIGPAEAAREDAHVGRVFGDGLRGSTILLWTFAFFVFIAVHTLLSWVPTLLMDYGFARSEAPLGLAFISLGGLIGGLVLVPLTARIGIGPSLVLMPAVAVGCMVVASRAELGHTPLLVVLGGAGLGVFASQIAMMAMAVSIYPDLIRTTGLGWTAALGRIGSIVGPAVAGLLLALALPARDIVLLTTVPVLVGVAAALVLTLRGRRRGPSPTD
ncbi:MFS transporter [Nonomuraea sp. NPDC005650]|uniref:MFS transporter n=1 Tax=Nonomuraea sp. NPDC005650 TaxID=3157045 RepID=UPI0033BAE3D5